MTTIPAVGPYLSRHVYGEARTPAAAVYCSDGRYGEQMDEFLHEGLGLPRYDRVAVPGGAACLASHFGTLREESALDRQIRFLVEAHGLGRVVLIAHQDCGFYKHLRLRAKPIEEQQFADLAKAAARIRGYAPHLEVDAYIARKVEGRVRFDPVPVD